MTIRPGDAISPRTALIRLAAAFDPREYVTTLVAGSGPAPHLVVARRSAQLAEDIHAHDGWLWWSWAERIAPVTGLAAAAAKIATVLRTVPEPSHG
jgi:hypothetical protein